MLGFLLAGAIGAAEVPTAELWQPQQGGTSSGGGFNLTGDLLTHKVLTNEVQELGFEPLYWTMTASPILSIQPASGSAVITWPVALAGWELEVTTNLTSRPMVWSGLRLFRETNHFRVSVRVPVTSSGQLYRLRKAN